MAGFNVRNSGTAAAEDWLFKGSLLVTMTKLVEVKIYPCLEHLF
jgi:hypothetical protein